MVVAVLDRQPREVRLPAAVGGGRPVLGRSTYQTFAVSWPSRTGDDFSACMNSLPKYVVSCDAGR